MSFEPNSVRIHYAFHLFQNNPQYTCRKLITTWNVPPQHVLLSYR